MRYKIHFSHIELSKKRTNIIMDIAKKMMKALIAGYILTLVMLLILTYVIKKFTLDEKTVNSIIGAVYLVGSFLGGMLAAWMAGRRRLVAGMVYGGLYMVILIIISSVMMKAPVYDTSSMVVKVLTGMASGAIGGFFSP